MAVSGAAPVPAGVREVFWQARQDGWPVCDAARAAGVSDFPKGTSLRRHTPADLDAVAAQLNSRPRKTLGSNTPAEELSKLLLQ